MKLLSIIQRVVPDDLKTARVVPLFKKNDKTEVGNYRPVSILSIVSKVLERVVYDQMEEYLCNRIFCTNTSLVLDDSFLLNPASFILLIIYVLRWIKVILWG